MLIDNEKEHIFIYSIEFFGEMRWGLGYWKTYGEGVGWGVNASYMRVRKIVK
jgi:hypothetical protein